MMQIQFSTLSKILLLGVAAMSAVDWKSNVDLNTFTSYGIVGHFSVGCTNSPGNYSHVFNIGLVDDEFMQIGFRCYDREIYVRFYHPSNKWSAWKMVALT